MIRDGMTFCNICSAEIPEGEPTHEFDSHLVSGKGHCHAECLGRRNAILGRYEETFNVLSALLDPGVATAQKVAQAVRVQGERSRPLNRAPRVEKNVPPQRRARAPRKAAKKKATKKKVKRGA